MHHIHGRWAATADGACNRTVLVTPEEDLVGDSVLETTQGVGKREI